MKLLFDENGGVEPETWLVGIVGFISLYIIWVVFTPVISDLCTFALTIVSGRSATGIRFVRRAWDYGILIDAVFWIAYIWGSVIHEEVSERYVRQGGYV